MKTIIRVKSDIEGRNHFFYDETPGMVMGADATRSCELDCVPSAGPFQMLANGQLAPGTVKEAGKHLYAALSKHPATPNVMMQMGTAGHDDVCPIYIHLDSHDAEELPWETLCDAGHGFFALDRRWQIGRIVRDSAGIKQIERALDPPLRLLIVLAAAKIQEAPQEWHNLHKTVRNFVATAPPELQRFHIRALVCDPALYDEIAIIKPDPHAPPGAEIRIEPKFLADKIMLFQEIEEFRPHLLHFFCHGSTLNGPHLEMATRSDWMRKEDGSIYVEPNELRQVSGIDQHAWLVVLNSCQGAMGSGEARSLARSLVTAGFPAVVGMRESVASADANLFCGEFYRALLAELGRALSINTDPQAQVEWVRALYGPRQQLCTLLGKKGQPTSLAATECKQWTLPVLYVGRTEFVLRRPATTAGRSENEDLAPQIELNVLRTSRARLKSLGVPDAIIAEVDARIQQIEASLYQEAR
jgi:hypothetical protein